jgi:hypothetical protein
MAAIRLAVRGAQGPSTEFMEDEPAEGQYVEPSELLQDANDFFAERRAAERKRFRDAHKKLKEMKAVNARGGDSQGFRYVVPKNVKTLAEQMDTDAVDSSVELKNGFAEDEVAEIAADSHADKPTKRKKRKGHFHDNFYEVQVWKKWTNNAEKFLSRGRASGKLFEAQGKTPVRKVQQRSIKKL